MPILALATWQILKENMKSDDFVLKENCKALLLDIKIAMFFGITIKNPTIRYVLKRL